MTQIELLQSRGIRRLGSPKRGFRYVTADGKQVRGAQLERILALRIPPAWTKVAIHPAAKGKVQAVGKDNAGRWQYRYHASFSERQQHAKYRKLLQFADALPPMRKQVDRDLSRRGLQRERVMACMLRILSTCFVRPGSAVYARENGHFGLSTLRKRHVSIHGDTISLDFDGKSGQRQHRELADRRVARLMRELVRLPGQQLWQYRDEDGTLVEVRRRHLNDYIKAVMGEHFSAKDFRTWAGTLICACALARSGVDEDDTQTARKKKVVAAVKEAAAALGNTPTVCRSAYIYPSVLSSFERGKVIDAYFQSVRELVDQTTPRFHQSEKALLTLLKKDAKPHVAA